MDDQNKNETKKRVDLSSLYPQAKTYDEIEEYRRASDARWQKRQPKNAPIITSINMSLVVLMLFAASSGGKDIFMGSVFVALLLGLMWFGFVGWQVRRLSNFFENNGHSPWPFLVTYVVSALAFLPACYVALFPVVSFIWVYLVVAVVNAILVNLLAVTVITRKLSSSQKISVLSLIVIASVAFAIFSML